MGVAMTMGRMAWILSFGILLGSPQQARAEGSVDACDGSPACVDDLRDVTDALDESNGKIIGEAGAEKAREMDTSHDIALEEEGRDYGLYYGNRISKVSQWPDASGQDCTTFVLDVLKAAFAKAGAQDEWTRIFQEAIRTSDGKFKGLELLKALQRSGWTGIYWNPDTKNPDDRDSEHPYSAYVAQNKGTYYGMPIDKERSVLNFRPTEEGEDEEISTPLDTSGIEALQDLPFGIVAARGGQHMALILEGEIYEVHWHAPATSPDVITSKPITEWDWLSGVIVVPPGY